MLASVELEPLTLASSVVNARVIGATRETKLFLSDLLSYEVEGADRMPRFKSGGWDGRSSFFDFRTSGFPAGFTHMIHRELRRRGHPIKIVMKEAPAPLGPEIGTDDPMGLGWSERYDYQPETVRRLIRHKRMIARVSTGGGKSRIAILANNSIRRMTLFVTTRGSLMYQMKDNFEKSGVTCGVIGDSILKPRRGVNVAMVQTIASWLSTPLDSDTSETANKQRQRRKKMIDLLHQFEFVIGEEAHEVGGNSYFEIMSHCINAHYRLALTATPFMRPDGEANMRLQAAFGSIGIDITEEQLINSGILAKPYFRFLDTACPTYLRRGTTWPTCAEIGIVENVDRNKLILASSIKALRNERFSRTSLTLVQRKAHGHILEAMFRAAGLSAKYVFGESDQSERLELLRDLAANRVDAAIGSTIFDVGVDVPAVGVLNNAGGGKGEVGYRQRIGRALREKKVGDNNCFMTDFNDEHNKILHSHASARRQIIMSTPGFAEGLLPDGCDFPW